MTPLDQVIAHVRAQGKAGTYAAILLAEVDRLRAILAPILDETEHLLASPANAVRLMQSVKPDERCECGLMTAIACGDMPSRHCGAWDD